MYRALSGKPALHALPCCGLACFVGLLHTHLSRTSLCLSHFIELLVSWISLFGLLYSFGGMHFPEASWERWMGSMAVNIFILPLYLVDNSTVYVRWRGDPTGLNAAADIPRRPESIHSSAPCPTLALCCMQRLVPEDFWGSAPHWQLVSRGSVFFLHTANSTYFWFLDVSWRLLFLFLFFLVGIPCLF